jgi:hypothetical protein
MKMFRLIRYGSILILAVLLASCSSLPVIKPLDASIAQDPIQRCRRPFLDVPYRLVHAIEASISGRTPGTVLGVTLFDPQSGAAHSAILTLEGFVLFDARYEKGVHVNRAVPPFDAPHFAGNMMEDIRLIFLAPQGRLLQAGTLEDGATICRYDGNQGRTVDVVVRQDDTWEIGTYGEHHEQLRRVRVISGKDRVPEKVELTGFFSVSYSLRMTLISAEPVLPEELRGLSTDGE